MADLLVWGHPAFATLTLLLAFFVFRDGFLQRKQRLRREPAPPGARARHLRLAPLTVGFMVGTMVGGLGSAVGLRGWKPLGTVHGLAGVVSAALFVALYVLGRRLEAGRRDEANRHGVIGVLAVMLAGLTGVLGISLLP